MFYLHAVVPVIGRLLLGNPDNCRKLDIYTATHRDCSGFAECCSAAGLQSQLVRYFFGWATGITGVKPVG